MQRIWIICICGALFCGLMLGYVGALVVRYTDAASPVPSESGLHVSLPATGKASPAQPPSSPETQLPSTPETVPHIPGVMKDVVVAVGGAVRRPGVYYFVSTARVRDGIREAGGALVDADLDDINLAARLMDNTTLYIPFHMHREMAGNVIVARRSIGAAEANPARYTRSGWVHGEPGTSAPPPGRARAPVASDAMNAEQGVGGLIHLNTGSVHDLQRLPGIGPKTAENIEAYRLGQPFRTVDELTEVHGIGPKRLEAVRHLVTVD